MQVLTISGDSVLKQDKSEHSTTTIFIRLLQLALSGIAITSESLSPIEVTLSTMASQGSSSAVTKSLALLMCVLVLAQYAEAATVTVGASKGWNLGVNYKAWAASTRVKPWDSMFFKYDPRLHNVMVVSKADYDACKVNKPWATYKSGKDYIKFTKSGTYYLICGVAKHCKAGMKLAVKVRW